MWNALRVKSRNEKKATERLTKDGFEVYCPEYIALRRWSDRMKKVRVPLFNGYIFIKSDIKLKERVFYTPGVVGFVYYNGEVANIRDKEIDKIKSFAGEISTLADQNVEFNEGDLVIVSKGNFEGRTGTITRDKNKLLELEIEDLGLKIRLKMPKEYLAKI